MRLKVIAAVLLLASSAAGAQDAITGKWSGSYTGGRGALITTRVVLDVETVEGETVKGRGSVNVSMQRGQGCSGEFPIDGTFKDNTLDIVAVQAEVAVQFVRGSDPVSVLLSSLAIGGGAA